MGVLNSNNLRSENNHSKKGESNTVQNFAASNFHGFVKTRMVVLNTRTTCEICSKLTMKTPERRLRPSGVFILNFEHISHQNFEYIVLLFLLLTLNMYFTQWYIYDAT